MMDKKQQNDKTRNDQIQNQKPNDRNGWDKDYQCGSLCFHPTWLQKLANKKFYIIAYAIYGLAVFGEMSSFHASISSLEKNFSLSVSTIGFLKTCCQFSSVVAGFTITYLADRGNKLHWISFGVSILFVGCFLFITPLFSPISLQNINAYRLKKNSTINILEKNDCDLGNNYEMFHYLILVPFLVGQILIGVSLAIERTCGLAYLNDSVRKNIFPLFYAVIYSTQSTGYAFGLMVSSYFTKFYVFPSYETNIKNTDPQWIGAWWLGILFFGTLAIITLPSFLLFPKHLENEPSKLKEKSKTEASWSDFKKSLKAILQNKLLMLQTFSGVSYGWGMLATFWPKYIEIQFNTTSQKANFLQGIAEFISKPLGIFVASLIIMKLKPKGRNLLKWNFINSSLCFVICLVLLFITCSEQNVKEYMDTFNNWNVAEECNSQNNCTDVRYAPVCDTISNNVFFSSCHAGCESAVLNDDQMMDFQNCKCVSDSKYLQSGMCINDCSFIVTVYLILVSAVKTLKASSKSVKSIIEFRWMGENEKSFSIGILRSIEMLFTAVPALMVYSVLFDASCLTWDSTCGTKGNCRFYDADKLRRLFFITASIAMGVGAILDFCLVRMVKSIKIYDEDFENNESNSSVLNKIEADTQISLEPNDNLNLRS